MKKIRVIIDATVTEDGFQNNVEPALDIDNYQRDFNDKPMYDLACVVVGKDKVVFGGSDCDLPADKILSALLEKSAEINHIEVVFSKVPE